MTGELSQFQNKILDKLTHIVAEKERIVEQFKVPLEEEMYSRLKPFQTKSNTKRNQSGKYSKKDQSKAKLQEDEDNKPMEESDILDKDRDRTDSVDTGIGSFKEEGAKESETEKSDITDDDSIEQSDKDTDVTEVTVEIKDDIKQAISDGVKLEKKINKQEKTVKAICRQATDDFELYSQENMDDLFESSDDSDTEIPDEESESPKDEIVEENDNDKSETIESEKDDESWRNTDSKGRHRCKTLSKNPSFENLEVKIAELKNEAYHRHLKGITEDILTSIDKVKVLFVIAFEQLDCAEGRDQCNAIVEDFFFRPLWKHLLTLFR